MVYIEGNLILRINRRNKGNTAGIEGSILVVFFKAIEYYFLKAFWYNSII